MEVLSNLLMGFSVALAPENLIFAFVGVFVGTLVGVMPGVGSVAGVAIALPLTFGLHPTAALIMLAGIYYGCQYGGSTSSILINTPGDSPSVMTCLDGYPMARQGRAGPALGMAAFASFIAGTFGNIFLMLLALPLVGVALSFGPTEYAALIMLALTTLGGLAGESVTKALMMAVFGLLVGTVGTDILSSTQRFTFGKDFLLDGISFLPVAMGLFALSEVLLSAERSLSVTVYKAKVGSLLPTLADWVACKWSIVRGTLIGFLVGILPGAGATLATFLTYAAEKQASRTPERFGKGAIEGVAAPEAANNAASIGAMVPLLTLGVPGSGTTAVMMGALMMFGLRPGPMLFEKNPDLVWGLIASLYVGNVMLVILNVPLIRIWVTLLRIPYPILLPLIVLVCATGTYALNNALTDVWIMFAFGLLGYLLRKLDYPMAPIVLGLVLGPMFETHVRRALILSQGDWSVFLSRPLATAFIVFAALSLLAPLARGWWTRRAARQEAPRAGTQMG